MPEKHLSCEEFKNLESWLIDNKQSGNAEQVINDNEMRRSAYWIGDAKEPLIILEDFDESVGVSGEADIIYPIGFEAKLEEAGVIFEKSSNKKGHEIISGGHREPIIE